VVEINNFSCGGYMKFTALPVKRGDSFYLIDEGKHILVDGGMCQKQIVQLLDNENIPNNHFDVLICTHYDADHLYGIIGILKSQKYTFKELWMPEILGSIGYTISEKKLSILEIFRKENKQVEFENIKKDFQNNEKQNENDFYNNELEKLNYLVLRNIYRHLKFIDRYKCYYHQGVTFNFYLSLKNITNLLSLCLNSGSYIRWFSFKEEMKAKEINNNLYPLNSIESGLTQYNLNDLKNALYLTTINKRSLVFKYMNSEKPEILFTADSDLSFIINNIQLNDNSIITAPHHGSQSSSLAYSKIAGFNLTFVRSDKFQIKRPCHEYLQKDKKYCTVCRAKTEKQKVVLKLIKGQFISKSRICSC
jgi:metallo-beta-lactamase superfamily protein